MTKDMPLFMKGTFHLFAERSFTHEQFIQLIQVIQLGSPADWPTILQAANENWDSIMLESNKRRR